MEFGHWDQHNCSLHLKFVIWNIWNDTELLIPEYVRIECDRYTQMVWQTWIVLHVQLCYQCSYGARSSVVLLQLWCQCYYCVIASVAQVHLDMWCRFICGTTVVSVVPYLTTVSVIWVGQGNFLTINSDTKTMGRNSGIFWALLKCRSVMHMSRETCLYHILVAWYSSISGN